MPSAFSKPPKTLDEQVGLLESRGMIFEDREQAKVCLEHLNYYRLRAYWIFFESDRVNHSFTGTRFEDVLDLYIFDRELRLLVLDAVECIEVSVRSQWAYHLAESYGPHAHLNPDLFASLFWQKNNSALIKEVERSPEIFVKHFKDKYSERLPPIWVVCEVMSFSLLSRWFRASPRSTKATIARTYNLKFNFLESWLHHLTTVRNFCAHHSRLWNREFTVIPKIITGSQHALSHQFVRNSRRIYNTLVILIYLIEKLPMMKKDHSRVSWKTKMLKLLNQHPQFLSAMDFPDHWQDRKIWK